MAEPTPADYEALMRRYFDACNAADFDALVACFTPDAVHYFPPGLAGVPWRSAETIARGWQECVATLGSQWTVDRLDRQPRLPRGGDGVDALEERERHRAARRRVVRLRPGELAGSRRSGPTTPRRPTGR